MRSGLRFTIALALAVALGGWLLWTSFGGAVQNYAGPEELTAGTTYRLNGLVAEGSPRDAAARAQSEEGLRFWLVDKEDHSKRVQVLYRGSVPDTWKDERELVLTGELRRRRLPGRARLDARALPVQVHGPSRGHPGVHLMGIVGRAALLLALAAAVYAIVMALGSRRRGRRDWQLSAERAVYGVFGLTSLAIGTMWAALLTDDFTLRNVEGYSSSTLGWQYKITALWASQAGSLLLWGWLLTVFAALVVWTNRRRNRELMPVVVAVLMGIAIFFTGLLSFVTSPFETLASPTADGRGLNPLLQNAYMQAHPPMLYLGYVALAVPFAFAIAALVTRRLDTAWIAQRPALDDLRLALPGHRDPARLPLGLRGARLGRLLGLGPGRERGADAVAGGHRLPALGDGPGAPRDAEGLEHGRWSS